MIASIFFIASGQPRIGKGRGKPWQARFEGLPEFGRAPHLSFAVAAKAQAQSLRAILKTGARRVVQPAETVRLAQRRD
jgi:hypothetical protein